MFLLLLSVVAVVIVVAADADAVVVVDVVKRKEKKKTRKLGDCHVADPKPGKPKSIRRGEQVPRSENRVFKWRHEPPLDRIHWWVARGDAEISIWCTGSTPCTPNGALLPNPSAVLTVTLCHCQLVVATGKWNRKEN